LTLLMIAVVALPAVIVPAWLISQSKGKAALEQLLASGTRVSGVLAEVGAPVLVGRQGQAFYSASIVLAYDSPQGPLHIATSVYAPASLTHIVQAGARCDAVIDPADPARLALVSVVNAHGVPAHVRIGSTHFPW
jgi:hypothetical protein